MEKRERFPLNAKGDFYVENDACIFCALATDIAPELIVFNEDQTHCYFKRQPETSEEIEKAIEACLCSETCAVRYAGNNPEILEKIGKESCDIYD